MLLKSRECACFLSRRLSPSHDIVAQCSKRIENHGHINRFLYQRGLNGCEVLERGSGHAGDRESYPNDDAFERSEPGVPRDLTAGTRRARSAELWSDVLRRRLT